MKSEMQESQLCVLDINYDMHSAIKIRRYNTNGIHNKRLYRLKQIPRDEIN